MATMNEAEQELYQSIYAMTIPDVRSELERCNLPTTGTKTARCQRLTSASDSSFLKESKSQRRLLYQGQQRGRKPEIKLDQRAQRYQKVLRILQHEQLASHNNRWMMYLKKSQNH